MSAGLRIAAHLFCLDCLVALAASPVHTQDLIQNPGFESWSLGNPTGWFTNNVPPLVPVTQSSVSHTGLSALQGEVVPFDRSNHSPEVFTGLHISQLDLALSGWYQFSPQQGDVIEVDVTMFAAGARVGSGTLILGAAASSYTQFTMPIIYQPGTATPDSCFIIMFITGSNLIGPVHVGSLMLMDDLALSLNSPLPIQISTMSATVLNPGSVELRWKTPSEIQNLGFEVQKGKQPAGPYATLPNSFIAGNGTTIVPHSYTFTDINVGAGTWYYRLRQSDRDGTVHFTAPVSVNVEALPAGFSLNQNFPNPFNPATSIQFELVKPSFVSLKVYNTLGQAVTTLVNEETEAGVHTVRFDGSGMASGVYVYRLEAGSFVQTRKLTLLR